MTPVGPQKQFIDALGAGTLKIQRCDTCSRHVFYPRIQCPHCGNALLSWVSPSGQGTVYSSTVFRRKEADGGDQQIALIDLDEGVRMMGRVENIDPSAVRIGMRVKARIGQQDGAPLIVFDPLADGGQPGGSEQRGGVGSVSTTDARVPPQPDIGDARRLRGRTAIVGVGHAGFGDASGFTEMEILTQAALAACADAGLSLREIDGLATCSVSSGMWAMAAAESLGIQPRFIDSTMLGGSSFVEHLLPAMLALDAGLCNAVLVCYGSTQRSSTGGRAAIAAARKAMDPQPYEHPYGPAAPAPSYALAAARHMHLYGTTREQLAEVAVSARRWAQLNPEALMRDELTVEQVLNARMVADPLTVRDCCLVTDGAGAFVMTRADRAKDLAKSPVHVLGNATAVWHRQISSMPDLTVSAASDSGRRAFAMAGIAARDADVVELYDAFTINTILFLEDLGFCPKGEGGRFVSGGAIAPGGRLAVNTNGGGLSCVHPGMYGIFLVIEAVRQLRGECGERQVRDAQIAVVNGNGGVLSSQSTAVLGTTATL
jgi:acetyl-CoA acetyltransferase/uncharacterized OB-fold protein